MATTLNVTLTQALLTQLNSKGVFLDYVIFNKGGANGGDQAVAGPTTLFTGGGAAPTGPISVPITLPQAAGEKVYFIVASAPSTTATDPIPGYLTNPNGGSPYIGQSTITTAGAYTNNYRFDSFEVSLTNSSGDQGNLTAVVGYGLPMSLVVPAYSTQVGSVTYSNPGSQAGFNVNGASIFSQIQAIQSKNTGDTGSLILAYNQASDSKSIGGAGGVSGLLTGPRYAVAPSNSAQVVNPPAYPGDPFPPKTVQAFSPDNWNNYLTTLAGQGSIGKVAGVFTPSGADANGVWHEQGLYNYSISSFTRSGETHFLLSPQANSQVKGVIDITLSNLANSIYSTLGSASVYYTEADAKAGTNAYTILNPNSAVAPTTVMNVGANNQWGTVFTQFLTGLSAGYYGGVQGVSPNA